MQESCSCSIKVESTSHYFLRCHFFDALRATLINNLRNIDSDLLTLRDKNILLYGNQIYDDKTNQIILTHVMRYTKNSQRFDELLFITRLKLLLTSYRFVSISFFNPYKIDSFYQVLNFC